jgi:hypothetical protein
MRTLVSGFGDGQEPIATGRCPESEEKSERATGTSE